MKGRTARAIQKLKHSPDFKELTDYLNEELEISKKTLVKAESDAILRREQGTARWLTRFIKDVNESHLIAKTQD